MTSPPSRRRGSHRKSRRFRPAPSSSLVEAAPQVAVATIFRRFWPETRGFRLGLLGCFLLVMLMPALDGAVLLLFMILVDDVLTPQDLDLFPWIAAAYLAVTVLHGVVSFGEDYTTMWVTGRFLLKLRTKVFAHLHRLSVGFFERRQLGDVLSRLSGDIDAIEELVVSGVAAFLSYVVKIVLFTGVLFVLSWKLALIALVAAPVFAMASRFFSRRMKDASREERRSSGALVAVAQESLSNIALVQAYDRQDDEVERFHREGLGSFRAQLAATRLGAIFTPIVALLQTAGVMVVIGFGVVELVQGNLTLGGLLVFVGYLSQLYGPIRGIAHLYNSIYTASAGAERVLELLDEKPLVAEPAEPVALARARGAVTVERVSFRYPGAEAPALRDISFTVAPGQKVAVVGASGAGKSTLAKLLLRAYDPGSGRIGLDGVDLRDLALTDLRANVVAVLQETLVFDGTIRENILWGRPGADARALVRAAAAADADRFITALPEGYDTRVGQRGRMLSGGQLQRLAIARAMIRDAPVLLLDEPTTGLDAASTQRIMAPLRRLMDGRTTIIISHNLFTVADADQILFLDDGRITGAGTHQQLLSWHQGYAQLYHLHHRPPAGPTAPDHNGWPHAPRPAAVRLPVSTG